ncbi:hypothetical protein [Halopseudomonas pertucinogena]|uniref:Chromosome segregation ATPase n=1 Tax=Halopseudomonas pertucinogena TaxID=86175 RepID=A0ABQ2CMS8_9GAMM|nr:hypothetical protein [Halopseudomonas pertucinogena]GGI96741.1 hypothetical protein GCM10009083_11750 [Halopseudomonas pertucinogena]
MISSDPGKIQKPLLTEAVMFFSEQGISREMLYPEFEALLDGLVTAPDFADETVEAVFLQINHRLHVRAAVFFTLDFDMDGYVNRLWNLPLRNIAEKAGRGPDMGGGPIRLACLGFCANRNYLPHLWKPGQRGGKADLAWIKQAVTRNGLGILGEDEEAKAVLAADNLQVAAEDAWYGAASAPAEGVARETLLADMDKLRKAHAGEVAEYLRQIGELQARLRQQEQDYRQQLDMLKGEHAEHLTIAQGELLDIKRELAEQQRVNGLLRRELMKLQSRTPTNMG